jgi:hypothetical protein
VFCAPCPVHRAPRPAPRAPRNTPSQRDGRT